MSSIFYIYFQPSQQYKNAQAILKAQAAFANAAEAMGISDAYGQQLLL